MSELVTWLTKQLDADEEWAQDTAGPLYDEPHDEGAPGHHGRVLADVAAKRAILALHVRTEHHGCAVCDRDDESCGCLGGGIEYPCRTIKFLALPYADWPSYRAEWRP